MIGTVNAVITIIIKW